MVDAAATRTIITRCNYHLDTSGFLGLNRGSQFVAGCAPFRDWATP